MTDFSSRLPRELFRADQVRKLDQIAIEEFGISGFSLMRTAATVAFNALIEKWPQVRHLQVFSGSGNNAGDGFIVAGLAREMGISAEVIQLADPEKLSGDARQAWLWAEEKNVRMTRLAEFDLEGEAAHAHPVIVDALLGTGLDRQVEGGYKSAIDYINAASAPVLAIDIPSGLSADTGSSLGATVIAELTVTFIGMKQGMLTNRARDFVGELIYHNLDVPDEVFSADSAPCPSARRIDINYAAPYLLPRASSSHKGSHGHLLIIGGDHGFGGAAIMAAEAAQRSGAGLVSVVTRSSHRAAMLARRPEVMVLGTEDENFQLQDLISRASAIVIGPGLGRTDWARQLMQAALSAQIAQDIPLIVDADGLHLLAERNQQDLAGSTVKRDNWILTPHPGEAAALLDCSVTEIQDDRFTAVSNLNTQFGGVSLLKGSGSLVCASEHGRQDLYLCSEGNAGMASGGMGDVLSGIVGSLVTQGYPLAQSLCCAVCIHGEAADLSMQADGQRGMVATDLLPYVRQLVNLEN